MPGQVFFELFLHHGRQIGSYELNQTIRCRDFFAVILVGCIDGESDDAGAYGCDVKGEWINPASVQGRIYIMTEMEVVRATASKSAAAWA